MLSNINHPCPQTFWPEAIEYACYSDGFGSKNEIRTSSYFFLTQRHVHLKYMHPFWTPVYFTIPHHERIGGKPSVSRALKGYFIGYKFQIPSTMLQGRRSICRRHVWKSKNHKRFHLWSHNKFPFHRRNFFSSLYDLHGIWTVGCTNRIRIVSTYSNQEYHLISLT